MAVIKKSFKEMFKNGTKGTSGERRAASIFFGPRSGGLMQFFQSRESFLSSFDYVINCLDDPGTKSIRLEEAIPITLALYGLMFD